MRVSQAEAKTVTVPPPELPVIAIRPGSTGCVAHAQSIRQPISDTRSPIGVRPADRYIALAQGLDRDIALALCDLHRLLVGPGDADVDMRMVVPVRDDHQRHGLIYC